MGASGLTFTSVTPWSSGSAAMAVGRERTADVVGNFTQSRNDVGKLACGFRLEFVRLGVDLTDECDQLAYYLFGQTALVIKLDLVPLGVDGRYRALVNVDNG